MLESNDLVAFVLTNDAARAKAFYAGTLGLKFIKQDDYALVFDAHGTTIRITTVPGHTASDHPVIGWDVPDIATTAAGLVKTGVTFEKYSFLEQDELGIWTSPDAAVKIAFFKDPDGNVLSIAQHKTS